MPIRADAKRSTPAEPARATAQQARRSPTDDQHAQMKAIARPHSCAGEGLQERQQGVPQQVTT
eukprot:15463221-Alexandrium_andersonii.AAC.1